MTGPGSTTSTASADWRVGDLAMCVRPGKWVDPIFPRDATGPAKGSIYEVEELATYRDNLLLGFTGWPDDFFDASAFRKVQPLSDLDVERFLIGMNVDRVRAARAAQVRAL